MPVKPRRVKKVPSRIRFIYLAAFLLSFHYAFTIYINSTYLNQFFTGHTIGFLYMLGSIVTLVILIASTTIIKRIGNARFIIWGIIIEICALVGLFLVKDPLAILFFFIIHQAIPPLLLFSLNLFMESSLQHEHAVGRIRSTYLTIMNSAFVLSPLIVGFITTRTSYQTVYIVSALFCVLFLFVVIDELRKIPTHKLAEVDIVDSVSKFLPHLNLDRICAQISFSNSFTQ